MNLAIDAAVEGYPDQVVVHVLCGHVGLDVSRMFNCGGKNKLDRNLPGYNEAARQWYWLVLRDQNHDADCPAELRDRLLPEPATYMHFRVVVREIEAWLLADRVGLAAFLGVTAGRIPNDPERIDDPKAEMVGLAARSRRRAIREDMVPRPNSGATEGPGYASRLAEYAESAWRPNVAAAGSESLRRCITRLDEWAQLSI